MTTVLKFHYLRSNVIGAAVSTLYRFDVSPDSYNDAWEMLLKEYDNKRALIHTYLQSFSLLFEGEIRKRSRIKETARHHVRRARNVVEAGMPSQRLGLSRSIYYDRETWLKYTSKME